MLGVIGVLLGIATLIFLTWKGWHMGFVTIVAGLVVILFNGMDVWTSFSDSYATAFKNFAGSWFLLFALGAVFGKIMDASNAAAAIANFIVSKLGKNRIVLIVLLTTGILSYGGISVFVIMFTMYPVCMALFKDADIPRKIFPGMALSMAGSVCMTFLPGSPSVPNLVPTEFLGTTIYAAPVIGILGGILVFILNYFFFTHEIKKSALKGEHFIAVNETFIDFDDEEQVAKLPAVWKAFAPIVVLVVIAFVLMQTVSESNFAVVMAMALASIVAVILMRKELSLMDAVRSGFENGFNSLVVTSSIMGFGGIITASPTFSNLTDWLFGLEMSPILFACLGINVICAVTGSASGGVTIFWNTMADYMIQTGINPQILHRITTIACCGMDSMPYSSGVVLASEVGKTELKDSYYYMFMVNVVFTLIGLAFAVLLYKLGLC